MNQRSSVLSAFFLLVSVTCCNNVLAMDEGEKISTEDESSRAPTVKKDEKPQTTKENDTMEGKQVKENLNLTGKGVPYKQIFTISPYGRAIKLQYVPDYSYDSVMSPEDALPKAPLVKNYENFQAIKANGLGEWMLVNENLNLTGKVIPSHQIFIHEPYYSAEKEQYVYEVSWNPGFFVGFESLGSFSLKKQ